MKPTGKTVTLAAAAAVLSLSLAHAQDMPDVKQMSGMPLPVADVAPGTVSVRVVKGALDNPIVGQNVELTGDKLTRAVKTNDSGRAEFTGLPAGTRVTAIAVVAGERLESQEFAVPSSGGIRLMLVATDPELARRAEENKKLAQGPAQSGIVVLGEQSRFVFELSDEGISVFSLFSIVNTARVPVQPPTPVVFELPEGAEHGTVLDGSSPQATAEGNQIRVAGPFAPGATLVQFAYTMHVDGDAEVTIAQKLPIAMNQLSLMAQKAGNLHLTSPQMADHGERTVDGQTFIVGQGPALKAGDTVTFNFTGLPSAPTWPRDVALTLAALILAGGAWTSVSARSGPVDDGRRRKLETRRDQLFADLTTLEAEHRAGRLDATRYAERRRELVSALERVYAQLDEDRVPLERAS